MSLIQENLADGIHLVMVTGRLDQALSPALRDALGRAIDGGHNKIVVDLSQTEYINSGGLRALVTAWRQARSQGGDLVICGLTDRLREVFEMVGFDKVFTISASRQKAREYYFAEK